MAAFLALARAASAPAAGLDALTAPVGESLLGAERAGAPVAPGEAQAVLAALAAEPAKTDGLVDQTGVVKAAFAARAHGRSGLVTRGPSAATSVLVQVNGLRVSIAQTAAGSTITVAP
ncbi:MAG: hypothetical protein JO127_01895 [Caulobacteraceae bacterium]|nr:hypothetical protein [Caulobacteraceae bacterium]